MEAVTTRPGRRGRIDRRGRGVLAVLLASAGLLLPAGSAFAADPVTFGQPTATSSFGTTLEFKQPVTLAGSPLRVEILVETPGAIGPTVVPIPPPATGESTLDYKVDLSGGNVVPNTTFTAQIGRAHV